MNKDHETTTNRAWLHDLLKDACEQTGLSIEKLLVQANLTYCSFCFGNDICAQGHQQDCDLEVKIWLNDHGLREDIAGTDRHRIKEAIKSVIESRKGYKI